jgi:hypothetical protein
MIWHIFKKDWTLMWPYAAGLAALQFGGMTALIGVGRFGAAPIPWMRFGLLGDIGAPSAYYAVTDLFVTLTYLTSAFFIAGIVQQDAIPGVRQDWLVRPIRRGDLLFAKLVAVLLMVLAPIFLADLSGALLNGFSFPQSLSAALGRSVWLWFSLFVAVFALAALTKNLMEAIIGGVVIAGVNLMLPVVLRLWHPDPVNIFIFNGITAWIHQLIKYSVILLGAAVLLALQYFFRRTFVSRLMTAGFVLALLLVPSVRWQTAFAIEERLSKNPAAGNSVSISFVPDHETERDGPVGPTPYDRSDASVMLPIRVTGLPDGAILYGETSAARIIMQDGRKFDGYRMGMPTWRNDGEHSKPYTYILSVPRAVYPQIADQTVRVEIDYYVTLLKLADMQTLPAIGGDQRTAGLGWCGTRMSEAGGEIKLGCVSAGPPPSCVSIELVYPPTGAKDSPSGSCGQPDYSPLRLNYGADALSRFTEMLPFGNPGGIDQYPVKEPMLPQSQVIVKMYQAEDHFERQLTIPQIRLRDWAAAE